MASIGILGAGTWGTALARTLSVNGHDVAVWSASAERLAALARERRHPRLPGMEIPPAIRFCPDMADVCAGAEALVFAVESVRIRETARLAAPHIGSGAILVSVAKGIESGTLLTMTQVIRAELESAGRTARAVVALSGPTHAEEVALDLPTTIVAACGELSAAEAVQELFSTPYLRVYTNYDTEGVELCGALKNIVGLAAGISAGLGYGDNAKAAIITRGAWEIRALGEAMGCPAQTFSGLAGIGDLIVTATSLHSRNNRCGILIGRGVPVAEAVREVGAVVEGLNALPAAMELARRWQAEMPILSAVDAIVKGADPRATVAALMGRRRRSETERSDLDVCFENAMIKNKRGMGMKRVITYGTFDLLHYGHINLLRRAKALGDYLIVAVSTDEFNWNEKHKKCYFTYEQRKALVEAVRYVDLVIPEESWDQKRSDVREYHVDTFVMGDDWKGKFDFLKDEGVEVVYLPRTPEVSSTQIKQDLHEA